MRTKFVLATKEQVDSEIEKVKDWYVNQGVTLWFASSAMAPIVEYNLNQTGMTMFPNRATYKAGAINNAES